jgi:hypothetical protein
MSEAGVNSPPSKISGAVQCGVNPPASSALLLLPGRPLSPLVCLTAFAVWKTLVPKSASYVTVVEVSCCTELDTTTLGAHLARPICV